MRRRFGVLALFGCAVTAAGPAAADDSLRCGTALVTLGMVADEVVARCGEPRSKETEESPVKTRSRSGAVKTVGSSRIERWNYDRGYGQLSALLTFEHGKLKSIELLPHH